MWKTILWWKQSHNYADTYDSWNITENETKMLHNAINNFRKGFVIFKFHEGLVVKLVMSSDMCPMVKLYDA